MSPRHFLTIILGLLVLGGPVSANAAGPSLLLDPATGEVMSHERAGEPWYPASLTKLMTAYLVFEQLRGGKLRLDHPIPVSAFANSQAPSKIGIGAGRTVTVDFALQALLVYSANDMAVVLAEAVGGTVHGFSSMMNKTAARLGMAGSHFVNPNGLFDPRQITTARDMALLATTLLREFPEHAGYFSQPHVKLGKRKLLNRNGLIRQMPESDGMKTGFVCNSGFNLVASATRDGRTLLAVILGAPSAKSRTDLAQMLLVDGFARRSPATRTRLADIADLPLGTLVPADMTASVCKKKPPVQMTHARDLTGWGITFGLYDTAQKADMALRGRILGRHGLDSPGKPGVVRMPGKTGYSAMVWGLDVAASELMCAEYRKENAFCELMTPEKFGLIAAAVPLSAATSDRPPAQGSDGQKKRQRKRMRK